MVAPGEVRRFVIGAWMLARNDPRGFGRFEMTADGFWQSFQAILYALPAFIVSWANYYASEIASGEPVASGPAFFGRMAAVDLLNWLVPIMVVLAVAGPLNLTKNFGRWVIATNWLSLPVAYLAAIPVALTLLMPGFAPIGMSVSLVFFFFAIFIFFRVTRLCFDGDVAAATALTAILVVIPFAVTGLLDPWASSG